MVKVIVERDGLLTGIADVGVIVGAFGTLLIAFLAYRQLRSLRAEYRLARRPDIVVEPQPNGFQRDGLGGFFPFVVRNVGEGRALGPDLKVCLSLADDKVSMRVSGTDTIPPYRAQLPTLGTGEEREGMAGFNPQISTRDVPLNIPVSGNIYLAMRIVTHRDVYETSFQSDGSVISERTT